MPRSVLFRHKSRRSQTAGRKRSKSDCTLRIERLETRSLLTASLSGVVPIGPPINPAQGLNSSVGNQYSDVAIAPNGDFVVVWEHGSTSGNEDVYALPYFADGQPKASSAIPVATSSHIEYHPRVALAGDGSFVVVWSDNSTNQVSFRRFAADGTAKDATGVVVDADGSAQGIADVAMYQNGDFAVAWEDNIFSSNASVIWRSFSADGTPAPSVHYVSGSSGDPHIAARDGVGLVVAYQVTNTVPAGTSEIWARPYDTAGNAKSAIWLSGIYGNSEPAVSMNANGDFAVAWRYAVSSSDGDIYARRYHFNGTPLESNPVAVEFSGTDSLQPAVGLADDDSMAVTYDLRGSQYRALYSLLDASNHVLTSGDVDAGYDGSFASGAITGYTALAMNGTGRFVVSWHQDPNADFLNQVEVRRFHADLRPTARDDVYVLSSATSSSISAANSLFINDSEPWGIPSQLFVADATNPTYGTLKTGDAGANTGTGTYTKGPSFQYIDRFTYTDGDLDSNGPGNTATVTLLSQPAGVVWKFYESVLNRTPDDQGLQYWTNYITSGGQTGQMAVGFFESDELLNRIIGNYYQQFLLRTLDAAGLAYWKGVWHATGGPEGIKAGFAASPEFYNSAGGTPDSWINALYNRILNRAPDPAGKQYWLNYYQQQVAAGGDAGVVKSNIALGFFDSHEAFANDVAGWFNEYLQRAPSTAESSQYTSEMEAGANDRTIEQEITNLPEYGANPPLPPAGTATLLPNYYVSASNQAGLAAKDAVFAGVGA